MREFRLRTDLKRAVIDGFALPLGFVPGEGAEAAAPTQGYTVEYTPGEEDEPDSYSIYAVTSHEQLAPLIERVFSLLPDEVHGIVEIGSRDAYRALDVYMGREPISAREFRRTWDIYRPFLLEDGSIGCGANSDDPFVEIFLDQWKGLSIHVPLMMHEDVEAMLGEFGLTAVNETWPTMDEDVANKAIQVRSVLSLDDEFSPGLDEMLLELRHEWRLDLNVDPDTNVDDSGRQIGPTLWHAMVIIDSTRSRSQSAYASVWATARSLAEMEGLLEDTLDAQPDWSFGEIYTIDRIAYDERPDELSDLAPKHTETGIHLVTIEK